MNTKLRKSAAWLLMPLLMTACAASKPLSWAEPIAPAQNPPPPPELMTIPATTSLPSAQALIGSWTARLEAWKARQSLCKATPTACV